jgi:hypothetical protein
MAQLWQAKTQPGRHYLQNPKDQNKVSATASLPTVCPPSNNKQNMKELRETDQKDSDLLLDPRPILLERQHNQDHSWHVHRVIEQLTIYPPKAALAASVDQYLLPQLRKALSYPNVLLNHHHLQKSEAARSVPP